MKIWTISSWSHILKGFLITDLLTDNLASLMVSFEASLVISLVIYFRGSFVISL